jgi:hypothetical protein
VIAAPRNEAAELLALYERLPDKDKREADQAVAAILAKSKWIPQPGPQIAAYFSLADELLFGGQAGGGKTDLLIGTALNEAHNSVIFRNGLNNLRDMEMRAAAIMGSRDGFNGQTHYWDLGQGRSLEFGSLEQPGSEANWQGRRRPFMGFDEAAQMLKSRVQFVLGWAGSALPGVRTRVIYATNPPLSDQGAWIIVWFGPWLDPMHPNPAKAGELRWFINNRDGDPIWVDGPGQYDRGDGQLSMAKSRTFIPSSLEDNRYLRDTNYRAQVEALPEPMRSAMLHGNFMSARNDDEWQVIPSEWLRAAQARWRETGRNAPMLSMGVDVAGGGKDREAIARLHHGNWFDRVKTFEGLGTKDGAATGGRVVSVQRNGAPIAVDMTGGWGGAVREYLKASEVDIHGIVFSEVTGALDIRTRRPFANLRAEMYWTFREALDPQSGENIALPPEAVVLAEGCAPRLDPRAGWKIKIESKQEIRDRLGASTDNFDALVMAWHIRNRGLRKIMDKRRPAWADRPSDPYSIDAF